jgi:lauroyl/myristoyl acyltransferase
MDTADIERRFMATVYEDIFHTLRAQFRSAWTPFISIRGKEHVDRALEAGRGAVLWVCPCSHAELILKKGFRDAGLPITNLRSVIHPYSGTRFGRRFLNPIRTRVEDRYLDGTVVLHPSLEAMALRELQLKLRENKPVSIFAIASSDHPTETPCLGGRLRLSLGAPTLSLVCRAPLLPVCVFPLAPGRFEISVEPPLAVRSDSSERPEEDLARSYAAQVESWIMRRPHVWRGWLGRSLWQPPGAPSGPRGAPAS